MVKLCGKPVGYEFEFEFSFFAYKAMYMILSLPLHYVEPLASVTLVFLLGEMKICG